MKMSQVDAVAGFDVIQMGRLQSVGTFRVGVVQDPLVAREIRKVTVAVEDAPADLLKRRRFTIGKQEVAPIRIAEQRLAL